MNAIFRDMEDMYKTYLFNPPHSFVPNAMYMVTGAILNNHYHFIAKAPDDARVLSKLIRQMHSITAIQFNRWDGTPARQVWYNYSNTCLTYEKAYLVRLHYIHMNAVNHGLVESAADYPYCSYRWLLKQDDDLKKQVFDQPIDRINVMNDF